MKKVVITLLIAVLALGSVVAAGQSEDKASGSAVTGTLKIWSALTQKERATELENLAKKFEALNPGVKVEITVMPWSGLLDKLMASIMAGNPPDIAIVGQGYPQTLAASGGLMELSDLIGHVGGKDAFLGTSLSLGSTEDGVYSMPLYITPVVAYYRQSYLDAVGYDKIPATWEEYYEMCKAVTDPANNRYGFGIPLGDHHGTKTIWSFLQANNVDLVNVDENGKWYVDINEEDRAAMVETYEYFYKLVKDCAPAGVTSYTQTNVREMVATGIIMSRIDTPEIYYNVATMDPDHFNDVKYFRVPGRKSNRSYMGWVGMSILAQGNTKLASRFIEYCYTGDTLVDFYVSYPHAMFPAKKDIFEAAAYRDRLPKELQEMVPDLALDILSSSASIAMANGPFPYAGEVESKNYLGNALTRMLVNGISAEAAVDGVIADLNGLF